MGIPLTAGAAREDGTESVPVQAAELYGRGLSRVPHQFPHINTDDGINCLRKVLRAFWLAALCTNYILT